MIEWKRTLREGLLSGTLAGLVSVGADETGTFGFSSDAIAKLTALGLY